MIKPELTLAEHRVLKYVLDLELSNAVVNVQRALSIFLLENEIKNEVWLQQSIEQLNTAQSLYEKLLGVVPIAFGIDRLRMQLKHDLKI